MNKNLESFSIFFKKYNLLSFFELIYKFFKSFSISTKSSVLIFIIGVNLSIYSYITIDEKLIPRLTERFFRIDADRSRNTGGTGLGLSIVKHVCIRHQAQIEISSQIGKGSQFKITFPQERLLLKK